MPAILLVSWTLVTSLAMANHRGLAIFNAKACMRPRLSSCIATMLTRRVASHVVLHTLMPDTAIKQLVWQIHTSKCS